MASLIDDLTAVLQQEMEVYQTLIPISEQKTEVLIRGDLKRLQEITDQEQELLDRASAYGHRREEVLHNIDRKSTRLNSSHVSEISYAVFCLKKKKK